jgi:hypothetical protein
MELGAVQHLLEKVNGCTFASLDAETYPKPGLRCVTTGARIILFTNKRESGYDNMVRRRLTAAGLNPDNFVLSDLPWGERIVGTPLIYHDGSYYLQTILLDPGKKEYDIMGRAVNPASFGVKERRTNQGLARGNEVLVSTWKLESITRITLMGETVEAIKERRPILSPRYGEKK